MYEASCEELPEAVSCEVFERNLWPATRAYKNETFEKHYNVMKEACSTAMEWIAKEHKLLWVRSKFSTVSKCDYVTNNIAETLNSWIRNEKSLLVVVFYDRIRQMIMERMCTNGGLAVKLSGKILPHVMKQLFEKSRNLHYHIHKGQPFVGEIGSVNRDSSPWKHRVDLNIKEYSCREGQLTGLPCRHAICFIGSLREIELQDFVDPYYSVEKFR